MLRCIVCGVLVFDMIGCVSIWGVSVDMIGCIADMIGCVSVSPAQLSL